MGFSRIEMDFEWDLGIEMNFEWDLGDFMGLQWDVGDLGDRWIFE